MPKPKTPSQAIKSAKDKAAREKKKKQDKEELKKITARDTDTEGKLVG